MGEISRKALLLAAAAWNVVGGASALLDPAAHFAQLFTAPLTLDDPIQLFFFRCVWINVIAWGLAYLIAALRPGARLAVLAAGGLGKFTYFLACLSLFDAGLGKVALQAAAMADLAVRSALRRGADPIQDSSRDRNPNERMTMNASTIDSRTAPYGALLLRVSSA